MNSINPYNPAKPGNLFVGYERLRQQLLNGFLNGNSFALLGGRRIGKTSLLIQIGKDLQAEGLAPFTPLPRFLNIQELGRLTPALLFERIYSLVVEEIEAKSWTGESPKEHIRIF